MQRAAWQGRNRGTRTRLGALVIVAIAVLGAMPSVRPLVLVTDATVAERVAAASSAADHRALAAYYRDKAKGEAARMAYYDALFRSYMQLPEKPYEPMQRQARQLLKAARMTSKYFELLASAHTTMALELSEEQ